MKYIGVGKREGGGVGVGGGWEAEGGQYHPQGAKQQCCVFSRSQKLHGIINLVGRDGCQQQFDTPSSLINAHQWPHRPCSGPSWFYRVSKRQPVNADLAIYSPGVWIVLECGFHNKMDFSFCACKPGFIKSSNVHSSHY